MWEGWEPAVPPANRGLNFSAVTLHASQTASPEMAGVRMALPCLSSSPPQSSSQAESSRGQFTHLSVLKVLPRGEAIGDGAGGRCVGGDGDPGGPCTLQ